MIHHLASPYSRGHSVVTWSPLAPSALSLFPPRALPFRARARAVVARVETDAQGYVLDADGLGAKLSPASFLLPTAGALLTYGFGAYFELLP